MNAHRTSIFARMLFAAAVAGLMTACAPVRHYPDSDTYYAPRVEYHDYHYYPAIDSYYNPRTRIYIYLEHNRWVRAHSLPRHLHTHRGHHVMMRSPHDRPYELHRRHSERNTGERYRSDRYEHRRPGDRHPEARFDSDRRYRDGDREHRPGMPEHRDRNERDARHGARRVDPAPRQHAQPRTGDDRRNAFRGPGSQADSAPATRRGDAHQTPRTTRRDVQSDTGRRGTHADPPPPDRTRSTRRDPPDAERAPERTSGRADPDARRETEPGQSSRRNREPQDDRGTRENQSSDAARSGAAWFGRPGFRYNPQ